MVDIYNGLSIGNFLRQLADYKKDVDTPILVEKNEGMLFIDFNGLLSVR